MVKKNIGKPDTMKSVTARLPTRMAKFVRSFFSNLYASKTNRLAAVLTMTTANRNVQRTMSPGVMRCPSLLLAVAVVKSAFEKPSETLLSAVAMP